MIGFGDFMGLYPKNLESKLRRILKRIKSNSISDPVTKGKIINTTGGRWLHFCCDTGSSVNLMPAKMAAAGGLKWRPIDEDEPTYKSVTNEELEIVGQTSAYVKLRDFRTPVKLNFLVCLDEGDEALLCPDTLKDLSIVSPDFPRPMDKTRLESRTRRVMMEKEELLELVESEEQRRHKKTKEYCTLQEMVGSLRAI